MEDWPPKLTPFITSKHEIRSKTNFWSEFRWLLPRYYIHLNVGNSDKLAPVPLARRPRNSLQFEILELGAALAKAARPT